MTPTTHPAKAPRHQRVYICTPEVRIWGLERQAKLLRERAEAMEHETTIQRMILEAKR